MKIAIIHYWLVNMRGGERVLEALLELFSDADVFTHVYNPDAVSQTIRQHRIRTTFIDRLPFSRRFHNLYFPLMPLALEQLDLSQYDLVISSESGPAKGVLVPVDALHVCYCHSPPRYLWDLYVTYLRSAGWLTRLLVPPLMHYLRIWDVASALRVDHFVANSDFVGRRIRRCYRRESVIIHPPVDTSAFAAAEHVGEHYLYLGHLVPYKRPDLVVEAFNASGRMLHLVGSGPMFKRLRRAANANILFFKGLPDEQVRDHLARCRALVFPGIEDFGITPVEAMASGKPVIAFRKGGVLETVVAGKTGLFFDEQTADALNTCLDQFEAQEHLFDPQAIRAHALSFDKACFKADFQALLERLHAERTR